MTDDADERFTLHVGLEVRMFLEMEYNRLRREQLRGDGDIGRVTYDGTLLNLVHELKHFRQECTCLDREEHEELLDPQAVPGVNGSG